MYFDKISKIVQEISLINMLLINTLSMKIPQWKSRRIRGRFAAHDVALNPRMSIAPSAMPRDRMSQHLHSISSGTDGSYHPNNALVLA